MAGMQALSFGSPRTVIKSKQVKSIVENRNKTRQYFSLTQGAVVPCSPSKAQKKEMKSMGNLLDMILHSANSQNLKKAKPFYPTTA